MAGLRGETAVSVSAARKASTVSASNMLWAAPPSSATLPSPASSAPTTDAAVDVRVWLATRAACTAGTSVSSATSGDAANVDRAASAAPGLLAAASPSNKSCSVKSSEWDTAKFLLRYTCTCSAWAHCENSGASSGTEVALTATCAAAAMDRRLSNASAMHGRCCATCGK